MSSPRGRSARDAPEKRPVPVRRKRSIGKAAAGQGRAWAPLGSRRQRAVCWGLSRSCGVINSSAPFLSGPVLQGLPGKRGAEFPSVMWGPCAWQDGEQPSLYPAPLYTQPSMGH